MLFIPEPFTETYAQGTRTSTLAPRTITLDTPAVCEAYLSFLILPGHMFRFEPPKFKASRPYWRLILQTFTRSGRGGVRLSLSSANLAAAEAVKKVSTLGDMKIFSDVCLSNCNT